MLSEGMVVSVWPRRIVGEGDVMLDGHKSVLRGG